MTDDDTCAYCHCPIESHTINGCDECGCGMSVFWDDDRGDDD